MPTMTMTAATYRDLSGQYGATDAVAYMAYLTFTVDGDAYKAILFYRSSVYATGKVEIYRVDDGEAFIGYADPSIPAERCVINALRAACVTLGEAHEGRYDHIEIAA